jgi:hypothetical protein
MDVATPGCMALPGLGEGALAVTLRHQLSHVGEVLVHEPDRNAQVLAEIPHRWYPYLVERRPRSHFRSRSSVQDLSSASLHESIT